jgi:hypothetical protein
MGDWRQLHKVRNLALYGDELFSFRHRSLNPWKQSTHRTRRWLGRIELWEERRIPCRIPNPSSSKPNLFMQTRCRIVHPIARVKELRSEKVKANTTVPIRMFADCTNDLSSHRRLTLWCQSKHRCNGGAFLVLTLHKFTLTFIWCQTLFGGLILQSLVVVSKKRICITSNFWNFFWIKMKLSSTHLGISLIWC